MKTSDARLDADRGKVRKGIIGLPKRYLTSAEVETVYGVDAKTLADWRYKGIGPTYIKLERLVRYEVDVLEEYFQRHTVMTRAA